MGVQGLQSFVENVCQNVCSRTSIESLAHMYRATTKNDPVIVIDLSSCLSHVYNKSHASIIHGGQLKQCAELIVKMLQNFDKIDVKYVVFEDGCPPDSRIEIWTKRRYNEAETYSSTISLLENGRFGEALELVIGLLPKFFHIFLNKYLRARNISVITTVREADDEIMNYVAQHRCFAILAQDSDFLICEGVDCYLSIQHLDIESMMTVCYRRSALAAELGISTRHLPLFATLSGNDVIHTDKLRDFHISMLQELPNMRSNVHQIRYMPKKILFPKIAQFIRDNIPSDIMTRDLCHRVSYMINLPQFSSLISDSVQSYMLPTRFTETRWSAIERTSLILQLNQAHSNWERILIVAEEKHRYEMQHSCIYSILTQRKMYSSPSMQFYGNEKYPCSSKLLSGARRRLYGVLLKEHPGAHENLMVTEFVYSGPDSLSPPRRISPEMPQNHPGLLALWDSCPIERKWELFCWVMSPKICVERVKSLPGPLQIPACVIFVLFDEQSSSIKRWQLSALVIQAIRLMCFTSAEIMRIDDAQIDPVACHLAHVYQDFSSWFYCISSVCGDVSNLFLYPDFCFYDGLIFHSTYLSLKNGAAGSDLCNFHPEALVIYRDVMKFVLNN